MTEHRQVAGSSKASYSCSRIGKCFFASYERVMRQFCLLRKFVSYLALAAASHSLWLSTDQLKVVQMICLFTLLAIIFCVWLIVHQCHKLCCCQVCLPDFVSQHGQGNFKCSTVYRSCNSRFHPAKHAYICPSACCML